MTVQFHVGQKVVCISNGPMASSFGGRSAPTLEVGRIYTITGIVLEGDGLFVSEAEPTTKGFAFNRERFRPVVERKTSIEIFTKLLNPQTVRQPA